MSTDDLTGAWTGIFNYPRGLPATGFTATLRDVGGVLTGETLEPHHEGSRMLSALIEGRRTGTQVTFNKVYDALDGEHDSVRYEGSLDANGLEINGRWDIPSVWSGSFIMVRDGGVEAEVEQCEPVTAPVE